MKITTQRGGRVKITTQRGGRVKRTTQRGGEGEDIHTEGKEPHREEEG